MGTGVTTLARNLRDGTLVIKDGSGPPLSITVALDEGDLSWTERTQTREIYDRGALDHTRPGDELPCTLAFTAKWTQLLGKMASGANALQLYEFLKAINGTGVQSTSSAGQQLTFTFEFTVADPAGTNNELITFTKVYLEQLQMSEQDHANLIRVVGRSFATKPAISRP